MMLLVDMEDDGLVVFPTPVSYTHLLPHRDLFTKEYSDIVNDPQINIVVEVMGGEHPAYELSLIHISKPLWRLIQRCRTRMS